MKNTWYISLLVIAIAILGIRFGQSSVANQEIVLKFANLETFERESQEAIRFVKTQLQEISADNVKVQYSNDGSFKITYYSDVDIARIKTLLSQKNDVIFTNNTKGTKGKSPLSEDDETLGFLIDVFEIQPSNDIAGATGTVVEVKSEIIRFFTPEAYPVVTYLKENYTKKIERAHIASSSRSLEIKKGFCTIPKVRAGPQVV